MYDELSWLSPSEWRAFVQFADDGGRRDRMATTPSPAEKYRYNTLTRDRMDTNPPARQRHDQQDPHAARLSTLLHFGQTDRHLEAAVFASEKRVDFSGTSAMSLAELSEGVVN
eukprot:g2236.t1